MISPYRNSRKPQNMGNWSTSQGSMTCRGLLVDAYEVIGFQIFCFYQSDHLSGFCHTNSWRINGKYWKRIFFANWWKKEGLKKAQGKWYHVWYPKKHVRTCSFEFPTPPSLCFCCLRFCGSLGGFNLYSQPKHIYIYIHKQLLQGLPNWQEDRLPGGGLHLGRSPPFGNRFSFFAVGSPVCYEGCVLVSKRWEGVHNLRWFNREIHQKCMFYISS